MAAFQDVFDAIASRDLDRLNQLISGDDALASARNEAGVSALMTAAYHQNADMVKLIREALPELDIFEAVSLGDLDRVQELLDSSESVASHSGDGFTPLHLASFFKQVEIVRLLISHGADVNAAAENASCVRPLHSAAASQSIEIVRILLENGADPNAVQHGGWTALQSASKNGNRQIIELLLQHGANPSQAADNGESAITMARDDGIRAMFVEP